MTYVHIVRFVGVMWMSVHKERGPLFKTTRHPPQSFVKSIVRSGITSHTGVLGLKVDRAQRRSDSAFPAQACTRSSLETKNSDAARKAQKYCRWTVNHIGLMYDFTRVIWFLNGLYEVNSSIGLKQYGFMTAMILCFLQEMNRPTGRGGLAMMTLEVQW